MLTSPVCFKRLILEGRDFYCSPHLAQRRCFCLWWSLVKKLLCSCNFFIFFVEGQCISWSFWFSSFGGLLASKVRTLEVLKNPSFGFVGK